MSRQELGLADFAASQPSPLEIAIVIDHGLTVTDATGPYEVLRFIPGATIKFVAETPGPKRADSGMLTLVADYALSEVPYPDVIVVPAADFRPALRSGSLVSWLQTAHQTARWTTSVCIGALMLGAAGLLHGKRATAHWAAMDELSTFGATPCPGERWVVDGTIVTAAGNSAGIDMALWLTAQLAGEEMARGAQLAMEYDPQPPFDSGSLAKASPETIALVRWRLAQALAEAGLGNPAAVATGA